MINSIFVNDWQIPKQGTDLTLESGSTVDCSPSTVHCLLISSSDNSPSGWLNIYKINFLDGSPAFEMYEN